MPVSFSTEIIKRRGKARHRRCQRDGDRGGGSLGAGGGGGLGNYRLGAMAAAVSRPAPYRKAYRDSRDTAQGDEDAALSSERHQNAT